VPDSREFLKVDPELFGGCDVCSVHPVAYRDDGSHTGLCQKPGGRVRESDAHKGLRHGMGGWVPKKLEIISIGK